MNKLLQKIKCPQCNYEFQLEKSKKTLYAPLFENARLIIADVAHFYGLTIKQLNGQRRSKCFTLPRQIAYYLCNEHTNLSTYEIALIFGKDRSSIIHGIRKIEQELASQDLFEQVRAIEKQATFISIKIIEYYQYSLAV